MENGAITDAYRAPEWNENKTNAAFAWKDIIVDGAPKKLINISVAGTQSMPMDWVRDFWAVNDSEGLHKGFADNEKVIRNVESRIKFPNLGGLSLADIYNRITSGNGSEYLIFVNGHSLGAAVANIYAHNLYQRGITDNYLAGYTFATPITASWSYSGISTDVEPIFNVINDHDLVTHAGAGAKVKEASAFIGSLVDRLFLHFCGMKCLCR